ncbi:MAG: hypothetical protein JKY37_10005 [Nannocystaceae bacterium]|nr:hypothetical protein [Nannocystaceae bacterium]
MAERVLVEPRPSDALIPAASPITKPREIIQQAPVAPAPDSDPVSEVALAEEPAPQPRPHRKKARRRRPRKQPRQGENKALNLESAMPPGLDGG